MLSNKLNELREPFPFSEIRFSPKEVSGNKAKVFPHLQAPIIQKRLNDVLGIYWEWEAELLPDGSVLGNLTLIDKETDRRYTRSGMGSANRGNWLERGGLQVDLAWVHGLATKDPGEEGSRRIKNLKRLINDVTRPQDEAKSAESDAFKRAAMKFGIGDELWREWEAHWVPYDSSAGKILMSHQDLIALCYKGPQRVAEAIAEPKEATTITREQAEANLKPTSPEMGEEEVMSVLDELMSNG